MFASVDRRGRSATLIAVAIAALVSTAVVLPGGAAVADVPAPLPTTVSADVLPTPQINGVVWSVAVVGTTAYAVGSFTKARPYGSAAGVSEVTRNNAMSFNVTTGAILSWNPNLNAQGRRVEASPDGAEIYVGGDFTAVNGVAKSKLAGFFTASGALDTAFSTSAAGSVLGIGVTNDRVYFGGSFQTAGGQPRANLAAVARSNGAILPWAPTASDMVHAIVAAPDNSRVVVGGRFQTLNGSPIVGLAATNGSTGATAAFSAPIIPAAQGSNRSWVTDLVLTNGVIYGTANGEGGHWFDGRFAAQFATGDLVWLDNCYGASYGAAVLGQVVYHVSHAHDCLSVNTFPQQNPTIWKRATADTVAATGIDQTPPSSNSQISHQPIPTQLNWYPLVNAGTYTGQSQGGWDLSSGGKYLVMGGEFTSVNSKSQQGLAVFATRDIAPNKIAPVYNANTKPSAISIASGSARVSFLGTTDYDDATLTYGVLRDNSTTPIYTVNALSPWWAIPQLGYVDSGLAAGSTHTYRIQITDAEGNTYISPRSDPVTISSSAPSAYSNAVIGDGALNYWTLGEPSGLTAYDHAAFSDLDVGSDVTRNTAGAIPGDASSTFPGSATGIAASRSAIAGPTVFTLEAWVKTTSTSGGKILGFGASRSGDSSSYDRHLYMNNSGRITFGVYPNAVRAISSAPGYNDGAWHLITASLGSGGMALYIDGTRVARDTGTTGAQDYAGYWRIGGDNQNGWPNTGSSSSFAGAIDDVAIYPTALAPSAVASHWTASGRTSSAPTPPSDAFGKAVWADEPDIFWRLDDSSATTATDSSPNANTGLISGGVTRGEPGALGAVGKASRFDGSSGLVAASSSTSGPTVYSLEAWFKTTTTQGGKIIGFGDQQTGTSSNYDRHVYMQDDGRLIFGTWTGGPNLAVSTQSYNDGNWHQVDATQGSGGMALYVDGVQVGSNPQTSAQGYNGYWRIGGDNTWSSSSPWFNGWIDEASVYSTALSPSRVAAHFTAAGGTLPNTPPTAAFTSVATGASVAFDASGSTDSDGTISSYAWDFGDSSSGTGKTPSHAYTVSGDYTAVLTVTDDQNATATVSHVVSVTVPPANTPPTAAFTSVATAGSVAFDASGSTDSDGTISSYAWNFGDSSSGTGKTPTHDYTVSGTYSVTLTVKDDGNLTDSVTHSVTVTVPAPPSTFASDTFTRSVASGWGSANVGGAWTTASSANFSVASGTGRIRMASAGAGSTILLNSVSSSSTEMTVDVASDQLTTGSGVYASVIGRSIASQGDYRVKLVFKANGTVSLTLMSATSAGVGTVIGTESIIPGITYAANDVMTVRLLVTGSSPTTLKAKVWKAGTTEPATWQKTATDSTAGLQAAGRIGFYSYLSGSSTNAPANTIWDNLSAGAPQ
ncbi:MAG: cell surface protein [Glaciihabitans sp.]|nr:cell surface protein [Glaciihabitans sp.]